MKRCSSCEAVGQQVRQVFSPSEISYLLSCVMTRVVYDAARGEELTLGVGITQKFLLGVQPSRRAACIKFAYEQTGIDINWSGPCDPVGETQH